MCHLSPLTATISVPVPVPSTSFPGFSTLQCSIAALPYPYTNTLLPFSSSNSLHWTIPSWRYELSLQMYISPNVHPVYPTVTPTAHSRSLTLWPSCLNVHLMLAHHGYAPMSASHECPPCLDPPNGFWTELFAKRRNGEEEDLERWYR